MHQSQMTMANGNPDSIELTAPKVSMLLISTSANFPWLCTASDTGHNIRSVVLAYWAHKTVAKWAHAGGVCSDVVDPTRDMLGDDLYGLSKKCKFCKEEVDPNAMELHCDECPAWPVKLGKCTKDEVPQAKKPQLNSTLPLSRKLNFLPTTGEVDVKDKIALPLKERCGGNSDARSTSPYSSLEVPAIDQHQQRLNDLDSKVAQHDLVLKEYCEISVKENSQLKQQVFDLTSELCNVYRRVGRLEQALDHANRKVDYLEQTIYHAFCRQRNDYDIIQANVKAVQNEVTSLQAQVEFLTASCPQEEQARLIEHVQNIQETIGRLEQHIQSHGNMIGDMSTSLTRVANAVTSDRIPGVDIRPV